MRRSIRGSIGDKKSQLPFGGREKLLRNDLARTRGCRSFLSGGVLKTKPGAGYDPRLFLLLSRRNPHGSRCCDCQCRGSPPHACSCFAGVGCLSTTEKKICLHRVKYLRVVHLCCSSLAINCYRPPRSYWQPPRKNPSQRIGRKAFITKELQPERKKIRICSRKLCLDEYDVPINIKMRTQDFRVAGAATFVQLSDEHRQPLVTNHDSNLWRGRSGAGDTKVLSSQG